VLGCAFLMAAGCHRTYELGDKRLPPDPKLRDDNLDYGGPVVADHPIMFHFKEGGHEFDALFAQNIDERGEVTGHVQAHVKNSYTEILMTEGWVYLFGDYPFVSGPHSGTAATGTTYIMEIDKSTNIERVYLLPKKDKDGVKVWLLPGFPPPKANLTGFNYIEIAPNAAGTYTMSGLKPIMDGGHGQKFIKHAKDAVKKANLMGWPDNFPPGP
jgi:hypothetical protein